MISPISRFVRGLERFYSPILRILTTPVDSQSALAAAIENDLRPYQFDALTRWAQTQEFVPSQPRRATNEHSSTACAKA